MNHNPDPHKGHDPYKGHDPHENHRFDKVIHTLVHRAKDKNLPGDIIDRTAKAAKKAAARGYPTTRLMDEFVRPLKNRHRPYKRPAPGDVHYE